MSRKIAYILVVSGLMFSLAGLALAQDSMQGSVQKERLQEKRKEIETKVGEKKTEVRKRLETARAGLVRMYVNRMSARYDAAINRLDNLAQRIGTRLEKVSADGKDIKAYTKALTEAKTKIETAKTKLAETKTALNMVSDSELPKTDFESARTKLSETKDAIKDAHTALVDVVNSIKGSSNKK
ncbi:MAG: hypothetical protein Q8Q95_00840 [bacterium]|nr:hypothetical protein [bacterium]